jgi:hypothetical protein
MPPEFLGDDCSFVSVDNDREAPRPLDDPAQYHFHTTLSSNNNLQTPTSLPESQPTFSHGTLPFITDHERYSQSNISLAQQAEDVSPLTRPDSNGPDHDRGSLEFAKESDRPFQSIRYMALATVINREEPSAFNGPAVVDSVVETNSTSAQLAQHVPSAASHNDTYMTCYSNFASEGPTHLSYHSYVDDKDPAAAFSEHRSTIQSTLQDAIINRYFRLFHPQWPVLHQETFQQNPGPPELLYSVALLGSLLEGDPTKLDALKALYKAVSWRLEVKIRQVRTITSITESPKINIH